MKSNAEIIAEALQGDRLSDEAKKFLSHKKNKKPYLVITSNSVIDLEYQVNAAIDIGYKPYRGLIVASNNRYMQVCTL